MDKVTGKVKKHKACVSEFDYIGWEDFGRWKRATTGQTIRLGGKHCEDECDFPSSCHWKNQNPRQETGLAYIGPSYKEPDVSSVDAKLGVLRSTGNHTGKFRRTGEQRTTQVARAILQPIEEEDQKGASFLDTTPKVNGLGLHPVMDFSSSKTGAKESHMVAERMQLNLSSPKIPQMSARVDSVWEDDVDMMDWITQNDTKSSAISSCAQPEATEMPFDFGLEQDDRLAAADDTSPISPLCSTWSWRAGGIGVAVSRPDLLIENDIWET